MQIWVSKDGQQYGPYTVEQLREYLAQGSFVPTDFACQAGSAEWITVEQILQAPAPAATAPVPSPQVTTTRTSNPQQQQKKLQTAKAKSRKGLPSKPANRTSEQMSKTFKLAIMIIGCLMIGSLIVMYYFNWSDKFGQFWFLCFSVYIPFYVFYADKKGVIIGKGPDINLKQNPLLFRFHQALYLICAFLVFNIIINQLIEDMS